MRKVIDRLEIAGLQVDINKCEFDIPETKYLGLIISADGIRMDQNKIKAIMEWEPPAIRKALQSFLGFANFYRRFIQGFSSIIKPLHDMVKFTADRKVKFKWTAEMQ
jgi:hypothetical protein